MDVTRLKEDFTSFNSFLRNFPADRFENKILYNKDLKTAASRFQVPKPFLVYKNYIENTLGKKLPFDLEFKIDDVIDKDKQSIELFTQPNFDYSKIKLDYLLLAGRKSAIDLGILSLDVHNKLPVSECHLDYPTNTSAGFPYFKRKDNPSALSDAHSWTNSFLAGPTLSDIMMQPCAVFHRFQYKISKNLTNLVKKIRLVWGVPFRISILEAHYFRNMVNSVRNKSSNNEYSVTTQGKTKFEVSRDTISRFRRKRRNLISVDISDFDSSVPSYFWSLWYALCQQAIKLDERDRLPFQYLIAYYNYTPYCWRSTIVNLQRKGVASGSLITNLFDTWVNLTVINYCALEKTHGKYYIENDAVSLGDDLLTTDIYFGFNYIVNVYSRFGFTVHPEKSTVRSFDEDFEFIGYIWNLDNEPTQLLPWYIAHLIMPSRFYREVPFPISFLQTYRAITICGSLKGGMEVFEKLIGNQDTVWVYLKSLYQSGQDPLIRIVSEDQRQLFVGIPLSSIYEVGWKAF